MTLLEGVGTKPLPAGMTAAAAFASLKNWSKSYKWALPNGVNFVGAAQESGQGFEPGAVFIIQHSNEVMRGQNGRQRLETINTTDRYTVVESSGTSVKFSFSQESDDNVIRLGMDGKTDITITFEEQRGESTVAVKIESEYDYISTVGKVACILLFVPCLICCIPSEGQVQKATEERASEMCTKVIFGIQEASSPPDDYSGGGRVQPVIQLMEMTREPAATDPLEKIEKLQHLLEAGAITQEEFDQKKGELLELV